MSRINELKQQYINKEIDKDTFYADVSSHLAKQRGEDFDRVADEVAAMVTELQLTQIQANKIWKAARFKYTR